MFSASFPASGFDVTLTEMPKFDVISRLFVFDPGHSSPVVPVICSYWPIVRSIRETIRTAVLKYGPIEVRSVWKAKVRIFSRMDWTNWSIRALLYSYTQRLETKVFSEFRTEHICVFFYCSCWKGNFPIPLSHLNLSLKKHQNLHKNFCRPFCLFIEVAFPFPSPIRLFLLVQYGFGRTR